jgi:hypothetical protein
MARTAQSEKKKNVMSNTTPSAQAHAATDNPPFECYAHYHMTGNEYAVWDVCRAMASSHNWIVYFSGPRIALKFASMSRNTPYNVLKALSRKGWFQKVRDSYRRADGTMTPSQYRVLSHDEWAASHPHACKDPYQVKCETGRPNKSADHPKGASSLHPNTSADRPNQSERSNHRPNMSADRPNMSADRPNQSEQTDSYLYTTHEPDSVLQPSQLEGMDFVTKFGGRRRKQKPANHAPATIRGAQPSQPEVTEPAVSDTATPATPEYVAASVMAVLGVGGAQAVGPWQRAIQVLLLKGHSADFIVDVAKHYMELDAAVARREGAEGFRMSFEAGWLLKSFQEARAQKGATA